MLGRKKRKGKKKKKEQIRGREVYNDGRKHPEDIFFVIKELLKLCVYIYIYLTQTTKNITINQFWTIKIKAII